MSPLCGREFPYPFSKGLDCINTSWELIWTQGYKTNVKGKVYVKIPRCSTFCSTKLFCSFLKGCSNTSFELTWTNVQRLRSKNTGQMSRTHKDAIWWNLKVMSYCTHFPKAGINTSWEFEQKLSKVNSQH